VPWFVRSKGRRQYCGGVFIYRRVSTDSAIEGIRDKLLGRHCHKKKEKKKKRGRGGGEIEREREREKNLYTLQLGAAQYDIYRKYHEDKENQERFLKRATTETFGRISAWTPTLVLEEGAGSAFPFGNDVIVPGTLHCIWTMDSK
jgi:hypothetical protein